MQIKLKKVLSFLIVFIFLFSFVFLNFNTVKAETVTETSNVLDDLETADNFDSSKFPSLTLNYINSINNDTNTSNDQPLMEVFQIAESSSNRLYLYVYQPAINEVKLVGSKISLSTEYSENGNDLTDINTYYLELVSTSGVFQKYLVKDFTVSDEDYRYYNIVGFYRDFNLLIDSAIDGAVDEEYKIGINVGQQWCVYNENDKVVYEMNTFEVLEVEITFVGNVAFEDGLTLRSLAGIFDSGDAWFVSFTVDKYVIDHIFDADITYKSRKITESWVPFEGTTVNKDSWSKDIKRTLTSSDIATYVGEGLYSRTTFWNRILPSNDFVTSLEAQEVSFDNEVKKTLLQSQWVFSFIETERTQVITDASLGSTFDTYYEVADVGILRLHFQSGNNTYNLATVTDLIHPDLTPDGTGGIYREKLEADSITFLSIIFALLLIVLLIVCLHYLGLLPLAQKVFMHIITAPFKFFAWVFEKLKILIHSKKRKPKNVGYKHVKKSKPKNKYSNKPVYYVSKIRTYNARRKYK